MYEHHNCNDCGYSAKISSKMLLAQFQIRKIWNIVRRLEEGRTVVDVARSGRSRTSQSKGNIDLMREVVKYPKMSTKK